MSNQSLAMVKKNADVGFSDVRDLPSICIQIFVESKLMWFFSFNTLIDLLTTDEGLFI